MYEIVRKVKRLQRKNGEERTIVVDDFVYHSGSGYCAACRFGE